jgi:hypothetical protein
MKKTLLPIFAFFFFLFSFAASAQSGIPCPAGCDTDPLCVQEDMCFRFEYFGAVDQGNGTTQLKFKVINASRYSFNHVMFELPGQNLPAVSPKASYMSRYTYSVQNTFNDSLIKFTGLNTGTFRYDQSDVFRYVVDSATFHNGYNSTIEVVAKAGTLVGTVTFNLEECDDMIIVPLPVELVSFKGAATTEGIALNWETATEKNNAYFSVQYSTDGRNFESIGYVEGKGTSTSAYAYTFTHKDAKPGKAYYRLKQVDFDNTYAYSKIIVIDAKEKASLPLRVYPNPVTGEEVTLQLDKVNTGKVNITITDLNGRVVLKQTAEAAREIKLNLEKANLKAGIYILNAQAGLQTAHQKIVIQ